MLDVWIPSIFPKEKVKAGVTKKNLDKFPYLGFSASMAEILDFEEFVKHRLYFAKFLGVKLNCLKMQQQVHGTEISIINISSPYKEADGLITKEKGIVIYSKIADCCAILIYDSMNDIVSTLHSGWRGTKQNIASIGINKLKENFGSNPEELLVYLSPCASGKNYEVGYDVAKFFPDSVTQISETKYLFDNRKEITRQLIESGVLFHNIEVSDICSIENPECHSYRRDGIQSGRMAAYISLV